MVKDDAQEHPMEEWFNLLGNNRLIFLFRKISSILSCLNQKQVLNLLGSTMIDNLMVRLSSEQKLQFLCELLNLNFPVVDSYICEDRGLRKIAKENALIEILRKRAWHSFSLESLTDSPEVKRAFFSDSHLIDESKKALFKFLDRPVLNNFILESCYNIESGIKKSSIRVVWIEALTTIWRLVIKYWQPSDEDLGEINHIKEQWINTMIRKLSDDNSIYDPQYYTPDKLPQTMRVALESREKILKLYQEQLDIMADCQHRLLAYVEVPYDKMNTSTFVLKTHISFIELVRILSDQKMKNSAEAQIRECAENLSEWFKEVIAINYPFEPMFFNLTKNDPGATDVLYLSTRYTQLFLNLLKEALSKKSFNVLFAPSGIVLREKETKEAIDTFLSILIVPKQIEYENSFSSASIIQDPPSKMGKKF